MNAKAYQHSGAIDADGTDERLKSIALNFTDASSLAFIAIDADGIIEYANPSAMALFGFSRAEMVGSPITIIVPERMRGAHTSGLARVAAGARPNMGGKAVEVTAIHKDGTEFPIEITISIWRTANSVAAGAIIKDITERRERDSRLLRLASQDTLTGLCNRHQLMSLLNAEITSGRTASVILIDLDDFKEVNDTHGHAIGDALLQAIGVRLPCSLRDDAVVARLGGDEFAVLLPKIADPLQIQAEISVILGVFAEPFELGGLELQVGASIGAAISPAHGDDGAELMASADFALYQAKAAGGNMCRFFEPTMRNEAQIRRAMRDDLRRALRAGELELHYQPQVNLRDQSVFGFESLIRWRHPERGLLLPGAFLPALEQSALTLDIGWWTLDETCRQIARLNSHGYRLKFGVNLFPTQFKAPNLVEKVLQAIGKHGIEPEQLELEVTEKIALNNEERSLDTLVRLRAIGVSVAFDDFGTGYASLSSLQRYPLSTLKIDRAFTCNIEKRTADVAIVKALITLSQDLGLETIAEGIETSQQEAALVSLGCRAGQGFRYGRAMPECELESLLEDCPRTRRAGR